MKRFFLFLALVLLLTIQLGWPGFLNFFSSKPDLLLVFAISLVFYFDFKTAFIFAVLTGLSKDLFMPANLAISTVSFGVWSYLVRQLCGQITTDNELVSLFIVLIAAFLNNLIYGLVILNSGTFVPAGIFIRNLIIPSFYSTALAPLIFKLIRKING